MEKYNLEITAGKIGQDGYVSQTGWVKIHYTNEATREYIGATMEHITIGGGLPAGAYLDAPELPENHDVAIIRGEDKKSWLYVTDHRGKSVHNTETRQPIDVNFIGDLPATLTLLEPKTEFDKWNGKEWVIDTEAQQAALSAEANSEKMQRLNEAEQQIVMLERKVRLGMATDEDTESLKQWEIYSIKVSDIDTSLAPDIEWPEKPSK